MPYYVRAFCKSDAVPSVSELESILKSEYSGVRLETEDARDGKWGNAEYYYKDGNQPVVVECNYNDGPESLAAEECEEFIEEIGSPGLSMAKRKVLDHLKNTKYIISCQLLSDIDDDGYHLNGELLNIFVNNYGGLIQADGEGFYKGHKLVVKLS
ncbi:MAG: hypothetical protein PVG66_10455 [Chromatiales bacterium]|jgi:hypothetical protein